MKPLLKSALGFQVKMQGTGRMARLILKLNLLDT